MQDLQAAAAAFEEFLLQCEAQRPGAALFEELLRLYSQETRHYHNLEHVFHCLAGLERFADQAEYSAEVALAIWFHDAIYNPKAKDNEAQSAALARGELEGLGVPPDRIERICAHVMATKDHRAEQDDSRLVIDLDLAILAAKPERYDRFEAEIREEFKHVPGFLFRMARKKVLKHFLAKKHIYALPFARELWEQPARENLRRAVAG